MYAFTFIIRIIACYLRTVPFFFAIFLAFHTLPLTATAVETSGSLAKTEENEANYPVENTPAITTRPATWAQPLLGKPGLKNFYIVSDGLYRSSQPESEGFAEMKKLGVKTVINLRTFHSDRKETKTAGLGYEHIYMKAWHPEDEDVVKFLKIVSAKDRGPFLVHCQHGSDRTGLMCAIYRVAIQGWTKDEALAEMTKGGYGFHPIWINLKSYFDKLDIEKIKKKAGIADKK
ncbi:MAG: dual specificity protein phosphatase family protein [Candidatus Sumerlaeota bacterium]|nr:dual specificity protein phosphatase family protein [Candidatus Sumerlaeota bacterium]